MNKSMNKFIMGELMTNIVKIKKLLVPVLLFTCVFSVNAAGIFNSNLSSSDEKTLNEGKTVIRNTGKVKKICINENVSPVVKKAVGVIKDLKPNYLAEIIQKYPYEGNEDLLDKIDAVILDVPSYAGIPYWSVQHKRYFDLYSKAEIKSLEKNGNNTSIRADLYMSPFGNIDTQMNIVRTEDTYYYETTNLNDLKYSGFKCVSKKDMKSVIVVFRSGDEWILYAMGGVDGLSVPFLSSRIETSFMNRIKTFCSYCFSKI
ncbi:MAG: hypothetical protein J5780_04975 [Treponema sp.]|nr:hypothetical protein [Treponema sp.]